MSCLKLDTTRPFVVLVGAWNPAIFSPPWVGKNILKFEENTQFEVKVLQRPNDIQSIIYIDNIGYSVNNSRFELYLNGYNENNFTQLQSFIRNVLETLIHTPFGNFGVNFHFIEMDPDDVIFDLLKSQDQIDIEYRVETQEFKAVINFEDDVKLNWRRIALEDKIIFDFNYERIFTGVRSFDWLNKDKFEDLLTRSVEALNKLYGLAEFEQQMQPLGLMTTNEGGQNGENQV